MMAENVFNTPFEISLRVLLTLFVDDAQTKTVDMVVAADFMTIYGRDFGIAEENLNGDNAFNFSEFAARRELVQKALRLLVLDGLVFVSKRLDGFGYGISTKGKTCCARFNSDYSDEYFATARAVDELISSKSEKEVFALINRRSSMSLGKGGLNG